MEEDGDFRRMVERKTGEPIDIREDRKTALDAARKYAEDPLLSGRGSPAFMSPSDPALRLLKNRYSESFALTNGGDHRVHLFLIKVGMWALTWTFVFKPISDEDKLGQIRAALAKIEDALSGHDPLFLEKLDGAVSNARQRIKKRANQFGLPVI
ncbi:MAG TPA: hypothetical protein VFF30_01850 [Nitrososphaerales archaeon]|nr:hypothetical protein [Nitrososphaerales archaeon]